MSNRRTERYFDAIEMGASTDVATSPAISVGRDGYVSLQAYVDNGAGAAPSDAPIGAIQLYASARGERYSLVSSDTLTNALAPIAPNGNAVLSAWAIVVGTPGTSFKLRYRRTSGGGGNSRLTLDVVTW